MHLTMQFFKILYEFILKLKNSMKCIKYFKKNPKPVYFSRKVKMRGETATQNFCHYESNTTKLSGWLLVSLSACKSLHSVHLLNQNIKPEIVSLRNSTTTPESFPSICSSFSSFVRCLLKKICKNLAKCFIFVIYLATKKYSHSPCLIALQSISILFEINWWLWQY